MECQAVHAMKHLVQKIKDEFKKVHSAEIFFSPMDTMEQARNVVVAIPKSFIIGRTTVDWYNNIRPINNLYLRHIEYMVYDGDGKGLFVPNADVIRADNGQGFFCNSGRFHHGPIR